VARETIVAWEGEALGAAVAVKGEKKIIYKFVQLNLI